MAAGNGAGRFLAGRPRRALRGHRGSRDRGSLQGRRQLGGVTFLDIGAVTARVRGLSLSDVYPDAGVGLRITTPIGPIRFDVGYALRQLRDDERAQFYVTVGHAF